METEDKLIVFGISLVLLIVAVLILNPFVIVNAGEKGVVMNWGAVSDKVVGEGLHVLIPIQQSVKKINVKTVKYETEVAAYSNDAQVVTGKLALNYHLQGDKANRIYQEIGDNGMVQDTIVNPAIQEAFKSAAARFSAADLLGKRTLMAEDMKAGLSDRLKDNFITVDALSLVNFSFSFDYEHAVEAKLIAQQNALKAENDLQKAKAEAAAQVAKAEAEASSIKMQAEAIKEQGGKDYIQLKAIDKWDGSLPSQMVPGGSVPFLDLSN
ncbi:MAG TPA: prohibitin family protein [Candidatus Paceibacterota bacterium]|nr:prohibitin family protein [Candidatus Pacearchaeota archaeon]HRZ50995.1 prohibitin family protein [Candidatus Paceibacterota bacterium]HSA36716.1 prohibitin family protein [Candidatus Paceibacterota bacterium]